MKNLHKKETKTYSKKQILNANTPMEFIHRCIYTNISHGEKQKVSQEWRSRTGYTVEDIKYARHRHPYWKKIKHTGQRERYIKRTVQHSYFGITNHTKNKKWLNEELLEFIKMNKTDKDEKYLNPDRVLAEHFGTSIPSIQYLRRKLNCSLTILKKANISCTEESVLKLIKESEADLRLKSKI